MTIYETHISYTTDLQFGRCGRHRKNRIIDGERGTKIGIFCTWILELQHWFCIVTLDLKKVTCYIHLRCKGVDVIFDRESHSTHGALRVDS